MVCEGTPGYIADEIVLYNPSSSAQPPMFGSSYFAADVFAYGITLAAMWNQGLPYGSDFLGDKQSMREIAQSTRRPSLPLNCPDRVKDLIKMCCHVDANKRPNFEQILAYLTQSEKEIMEQFEKITKINDTFEKELAETKIASQSRAESKSGVEDHVNISRQSLAEQDTDIDTDTASSSRLEDQSRAEAD